MDEVNRAGVSEVQKEAHEQLRSEENQCVD